MKKLLALVLILALLLPAAALAEDPIVGHWYMLFDKEAAPEFASTFGNSDFVIMVLSFLSDGTVFQSESDVIDKTGTATANPAGKWEKKGSKYEYSVLVLGSGAAMIEDGYLILQIQESDIYLRLRKLEPTDFYKDYVFR